MTTLSEHDRHSVVRPLSGEVTASLIRCFGNHPSATDTDERVARDVLSQLRDREAWIACDCRGAGVDPQPLMAPRLREGQIHIWRHGVTPHDAACPFWVEAAQPADRPEKPVDGIMSPWHGGWLLLKQAATSVSDGKPSAVPSAPGRTAVPIPAIARQLRTALTEAGYTAIAPGDVVTRKGFGAKSRRQDAYAALGELLSQPVAPELALRDVGCTFLPALPAHLKRLESMVARFPPGVRPQGIFLGIVDEVVAHSATETRLVWRGGKDGRTQVVGVRGRVKQPGYAKTAEGPFWVIAQLGRLAGETRFSVLGAYAHPCLSRSVLLPVDSGFERKTAEILLSQITYWASAKGLGVEVQLEKPLFPEVLADGTSCHPDFVLWLPDRRRIIVEAMGMDKDPDYLASKAVTLPRMRQLPGVVALIEHKPDDEPAKLAKMLTAVVARTTRA